MRYLSLVNMKISINYRSAKKPEVSKERQLTYSTYFNENWQCPAKCPATKTQTINIHR